MSDLFKRVYLTYDLENLGYSDGEYVKGEDIYKAFKKRLLEDICVSVIGDEIVINDVFEVKNEQS